VIFFFYVHFTKGLLFSCCLKYRVPAKFTGTFWFYDQALSPFEDKSAHAVCCLAFNDDGKNIHFFEGKMKGLIVEPKGSRKFGWDAIFQATGKQETFGEMHIKEKNHISPRGIAAAKFKQFLRLRATRK
jgi:inosine triphosphate pyrophosphatase